VPKLFIKLHDEYLLRTSQDTLFELVIWGKAGDYYGVVITPLREESLSKGESIHVRITDERRIGWMTKESLRNFLKKAENVLLISDEGMFIVSEEKK